MKYVKKIIATSHVDSYGDMFALEALESLVEQIKTMYIPVNIEHDLRIPPHGRLISAKLIMLEDGEYAVEAVSEIFEESDKIELVNNSREMPLYTYDIDTLGIHYDLTYKDPESQKIIKEISTVFNATPQEEVKKALEPISILTIGGAFILGAVAGGFFNKLGSDAWDALKEKLKRLLKKQGEKSNERLLTFKFTLISEDSKTISEIILTNPNDDDIESFFNHGFKQLDEISPKYTAPSIGLKKIVFCYSHGKLSLEYGVRKDAVPIYPKTT